MPNMKSIWFLMNTVGDNSIFTETSLKQKTPPMNPFHCETKRNLVVCLMWWSLESTHWWQTDVRRLNTQTFGNTPFGRHLQPLHLGLRWYAWNWLYNQTQLMNFITNQLCCDGCVEWDIEGKAANRHDGSIRKYKPTLLVCGRV